MSIGPNLSQTPINVLQQAVLGQIPSIQPASALGELNSRVKNAQMQQAALGQNAMQQSAMQQQQPPVAAGVLQASQGIDHPGYGFAGGGIVAFAQGGGVQKFQYGGPSVSQSLSLPPHPLLGGYELRASPSSETDEEYARRKKAAEQAGMTPFERLLRAVETESGKESPLRQWMYPNKSVDKPTDATLLEQAKMAEANQMPEGIAAVAPPTAPRPGGVAQTAPGAKTGVRPQVAPRPQPAPAQDDFLKRLQVLSGQEEELAKLAGAVTPEIQKAREEYGAARTAGSEKRKTIEERQQEALNQRMAEVEKQAAVSPSDDPALLGALARGARGKTFSEVASGAAGEGGAEYTRQKKELRDLRDKIRADQLGVDTLTLARMDYDAATKQVAVADATGDRAQKLAAETKLLEARRHLMDTESKYTHGKEQLATQIKVAQIGAAAKEAGLDFNKVRAAQQLAQSNPQYKAAVTALERIKGLPPQTQNSPSVKAELEQHQKTIRDIEKTVSTRLGVPPEWFGVSLETPGASPGAAGQGKVYDWNQISAPKS